MSEKLGYENVYALVKLGLAVGMGVDKSLTDDGKIGWRDVGNIVPILKEVAPAISGLGQVKAELDDLSEAERVAMLQRLSSDFDLTNDALEAVIERGLKIGLEVAGLVHDLKAMKKPS